MLDCSVEDSAAGPIAEAPQFGSSSLWLLPRSLVQCWAPVPV